MVYENRLEKLITIAEEENVSSILVSQPPNVFYFTGYRGAGMLLYSRNTGFVLLTPPLEYLNAMHSLEETGLLDKIEVIAYQPYGLPEDLLLAPSQKVLQKSLVDAIVHLIGEGSKTGTDLNSLALFQDLSKKLQLTSVTDRIVRLRMVKEQWELERIETAISIAEEALRAAIENLDYGVSEQEIAGIIEYTFRALGADDHSFPPIVAFGENTVYPHAMPSRRRRLEPGMPVLIDLGAIYKGYCSDMTRTLVLDEGPEGFREAAEAVLESVEEAIDTVAPGIKAGEVDARAREVLRKHGLAYYFNHSLGHGVGIEIHEPPRISFGSDVVLEPGMVITIEPGVYIPGKYGVRIEEMILVTKKGAKKLTQYPSRLWL
ncbi:aminopeptidase P family protein [Pyrofollis japonicus]|uniref:M24 family metallopeptidase n=1 Tax=Pyrofollis japonicus TaxID=3060460 RepID=UPI00295AEF18|nr:Xaa-Pro peptidase family protein [Pyrofollis japonicus]BEP18597.1 aminopeptidase P family protein [Pyrofollis japonicus]